MRGMMPRGRPRRREAFVAAGVAAVTAIGLVVIPTARATDPPASSTPDISFSATSRGAGSCTVKGTYTDIDWDSYPSWAPIPGSSRRDSEGQVNSDMEITGPCVNNRRVTVHLISYSPLANALSEVTIDGHTVIRNIDEGERKFAERNGARVALRYTDTPPFSTNVFHLNIYPERTQAASLRNGYGDRQRCLDVEWGRIQAGTPVRFWECNGTDSQRFVKQVGWRDWSRIQPVKDHLCLSARDSGNTVEIVECATLDEGRQNFRFTDTTNGVLRVGSDSREECLSRGESDQLLVAIGSNCQWEGSDDWVVVTDAPRLSQRCNWGVSATGGGWACLRSLQAQLRRDGRWLLSWRGLGQRWAYRTAWDGGGRWSDWNPAPRAIGRLPRGERHHLIVEARRGDENRSWRVAVKR